MATIHVHRLKGDVQKAIDYIVDPSKTQEDLIYSKNCNAHSAKLEWDLKAGTKLNNIKNSDDLVTGYHFYQSFPIDSIAPEEAFEISKRWMDEITEDNHDYVLAVHKDKKHIHTHIIVNPRRNDTHKKWDIFFKRDVNKFKEASDKICQEFNQPILNSPRGNGKSYYEWMMENSGDTLKELIAKTIDTVIPKVCDYNQFNAYLQKLGFEVEDGLAIPDVPLDENKEFKFSISNKMFHNEKEMDDSYFVRMPYTKNYIYLSKEKSSWTTNQKTCFTSLNKSDIFTIYNQEGIKINELTGKEVSAYFEDKSKIKEVNGRKGLRIKVPSTKKFIRCHRIEKNDEDKGYSLEEVIERIFDEGKIISDPEVETFIGQNTNEKQTRQLRNHFYDEANIKTRYNLSSYSKLSKREKYIYHKTKEIQDRLNNMYLDTKTIEDVPNLNHLIELREDLVKQLNQINSSIKNNESTYSQMIVDRLDGLLDVSEAELDQFVVDNIKPYRKLRFETKNKIDELSKRIEKIKEIKSIEERKNIEI